MVERIRLRRGLAATWTSNNPVLALGELGLEYDTGQMKVGDGLTDWVTLPYMLQGPAGADGLTLPQVMAVSFGGS